MQGCCMCTELSDWHIDRERALGYPLVAFADLAVDAVDHTTSLRGDATH
jgi:isoleucyl-tRNA synthetase